MVPQMNTQILVYFYTKVEGQKQWHRIDSFNFHVSGCKTTSNSLQKHVDRIKYYCYKPYLNQENGELQVEKIEAEH